MKSCAMIDPREFWFFCAEFNSIFCYLFCVCISLWFVILYAIITDYFVYVHYFRINVLSCQLMFNFLFQLLRNGSKSHNHQIPCHNPAIIRRNKPPFLFWHINMLHVFELTCKHLLYRIGCKTPDVAIKKREIPTFCNWLHWSQAFNFSTLLCKLETIGLCTAVFCYVIALDGNWLFRVHKAEIYLFGCRFRSLLIHEIYLRHCCCYLWRYDGYYSFSFM